MKTIPALTAVHRTDEFLVFKVDSETTPGMTYRVDKSLWYGSGSCACEDFCCRVQPRLGKGDWTEPTTCKHIRLVDRWIALQVCQGAIEDRKSDKPYNPSEPNL